MVTFPLIRFVTSRSEALRLSPRGKCRFSFNITVSQDHEKRESRRWFFLSSGRRDKVVQTLFAKWLWDELKAEELEVFLLFPEILQDPVIVSSLTARAKGLSKKIIREKLLELQGLGVLKVPTHQQYKSMIGQLSLFLVKERVTLRKTRKYSGYARHHNDKGSLRTSPVEDLTSTEWQDEQFEMEEFIMEYFFSVYGLPMFSDMAVLKIGSRENRNGKNLSKKVNDGTIL